MLFCRYNLERHDSAQATAHSSSHVKNYYFWDYAAVAGSLICLRSQEIHPSAGENHGCAAKLWNTMNYTNDDKELIIRWWGTSKGVFTVGIFSLPDELVRSRSLHVRVFTWVFLLSSHRPKTCKRWSESEQMSHLGLCYYLPAEQGMRR